MGTKGMEMLLKSLGFDPESIKGIFEKFQGDLAAVLQNFNARLVAIEAQEKANAETLAAVLAAQMKILEYISSGTLPAGPSSLELGLVTTDGRNASGS